MKPSIIVKSNRYWRLCAGGGALVIALAAILGSTFPKEGAGFASGYGTPVIAFEMAKTPEDLEAVFGLPGDPLRPQRLHAMNAGNRLDFGFMLAYGTFIVCFFLAAWGDDRRRVWLCFAALGVVAGLADAVETTTLLNLAADLGNASYLQMLPYPVWTKFLALMGAGIGAGWFLVERHRGLWLALGALSLLSASTVALGFYAPASFTGLMGSGIAIVWGVQWIYALTRVAR